MQINRNILINNPDKELLIEIINHNFKQNELIDFWNKVNKNIIVKENKERWPDYLFFCKDKYITQDNLNGIIMYYNRKIECFVMDYDKMWSIFKSKFNLNTQNINEFIAGRVFEIYRLKVVTTMHVSLKKVNSVFEIYRLKVVTTNGNHQ